VVVVVSIAVIYFLKLTAYGVSIVGEIPSGLPGFRFPQFDLELMEKLLPTILTLALVAFLEAISVAKAVHANHRNYEIKPNQELIALGLANLLGSLFQSFSVTGGFSRTAVNDQAGANTPLASVISASLIGLTLLFLTPLFYYLPNAVLAAIIVVAVLGLFNWQEPIRLWKTERLDLIMLLGTFIATLVFGIANGIGVGVGLSIMLVVYKSAYPHVAQLGLIEGTRYYRNILRFSQAKTFEDILIIRFDAQLFFANANYFRDITLKWASKKKDLKAILFDFQAVNSIDSTACKVLDEMLDFYGSRNVQLLFAGVKGPVRDKMKASGFVEKAQSDSFFMNVAEAKESFFNEATPESSEYTHQANSY
jgi:SulP family sulfate permease